jgi:hypothetical protein
MEKENEGGVTDELDVDAIQERNRKMGKELKGEKKTKRKMQLIMEKEEEEGFEPLFVFDETNI